MSGKATITRANRKALDEKPSGNVPFIDWAYKKIKEMIFQQKLIPGQKLIYKDLSQELNVSRTPIINALTRLEQEGYVTSESFRGFYIKPVDIKEIFDHFGIREALEAYSVEKAMRRANSKNISNIKKLINAHKSYMPPIYDKKKLFLDSAVHIEIAKMTKNKGLVDLLTKNLEHIYLRMALPSSFTERMKPAVEEHQELLKLMIEKDEKGCIALMREHIQKGRDHIIASLSREKENLPQILT